MDSSSLVALASRHLPFLSTYTCGFHMHGVGGIESHYDERTEAELTANAFGTEHYEMVINSTDITRSLPK
jgi:asparagine synthase (glutamine-hydrolysing)